MSLRPTSRPLTPLKKTSFDHDGQNLWSYIVGAEAYALTLPRLQQDSLIGIRVLGHLLEDVWNHRTSLLGLTPYQRLKLEIQTCLSSGHQSESEADRMAVHKKLCQTGLFYRNFMMRVFMSNTGSMPPTPSHHPSRPLSFEYHLSEVVQAQEEAPNRKPSIKKQALFRDSHRCLLSGLVDGDSVLTYPHVEEQCAKENTLSMPTQVAHIFSESAQETNKEYSATALAQLSLFGLSSVVDKILKGNVNSLENVMTMETSLHRQFDLMNLWLEPVDDKPDTYNVCGPYTKARFLLIRPREQVTFAVSPEVEAECIAAGKPLPPLPNAELLALRAACSRVVHLSGAAERADEILKDMEDTTVLAHDGGMAELLAARLSMIPMS